MAEQQRYKPNPKRVLEELKAAVGSALHAKLDGELWVGVLEPMLAMYLPPERGEGDADQLDMALVCLREYIADLAGFPDTVLREGWLAARRAHKGPSWPKPEVIRAACQAVAPKASWTPRERGPVSYRLMVERWLEGPAGQRALSEGWAASGAMIVERTGEFLEPAECERQRAAQLRLERWAWHPDECPYPGQHAMILGFCKTSAEKNDALAQRFLQREKVS